MIGMTYKPSEKLRALKMWLEEKVDILLVARRFKCTVRSLWRWKAQFDGTLESLENKSHRPHNPHPNSHTKEEETQIDDLLKKKPHITYTEALGILRSKHAYSRTYGGFYNFVIRHKLRPAKDMKRYIPKPYHTPEMLGVKMQMDVKYVPVSCFKGEVVHKGDDEYFQYTMLDEATRERFIFPYKEHNVTSTLDFVKRAIVFFGYIPERIQTDNGLEFTNHKEKRYKDGTIVITRKVHALDTMLEKLGIKHQLIRPYTPRLNGKVERSHRSDQESFYNYLKFKTLDELKKKMCDWNIRYNNRPHTRITNKFGKRTCMSPLEKRAELLGLLEEYSDKYKIRFIKNQQSIRKVYKL